MPEDANYDVFISFSTKDQDKVQPIYDKLTAFGLRVFMSTRVVRPGQPLSRTVTKALMNSQHFLVYWSRSAAESGWVESECEMFFGQCHVKDINGRVMFPVLDSEGDRKTLPAYLKEPMRASVDDVVTEIVREILSVREMELDQIASA